MALLVFALVHLFPLHAQSQQALSTAEISALLVGQRIKLASGTMEFFADGRVETLTNAGRAFHGTYTIADGQMCRDYGTNGGRKCYRVVKDSRGFSIVDNANMPLNFSVPDGRAAPPRPQAGQSAVDQRESAGTHPDVARALRGRGRDGAEMELSGTTIVSQYAIQKWLYRDSGGTALLRYTPASGWQVVISSGGAFTAAELASTFGVPRAIADRLCPGKWC